MVGKESFGVFSSGKDFYLGRWVVRGREHLVMRSFTQSYVLVGKGWLCVSETELRPILEVFHSLCSEWSFSQKKSPERRRVAGYQNEGTSEFIDFYLLNEYFSNDCLLSHVYPHMHLYQLRCPKIVCILGKREWLGSLFTWERCLNVLCCWSLVIIDVFWAWPGAVWTHLLCSQPWFCVQIYPARLVHKPLVFHGRTGLETCLGIYAGSVFTAATHMSRRGGCCCCSKFSEICSTYHSTAGVGDSPFGGSLCCKLRSCRDGLCGSFSPPAFGIIPCAPERAPKSGLL